MGDKNCGLKIIRGKKTILANNFHIRKQISKSR